MSHLSGLRFQQTAVSDVPLPLPPLAFSTPLPPFGNSNSNNITWVNPNLYYKGYGEELKANKQNIYKAATEAGATYSERALIIAMAMVKVPTTPCTLTGRS